MRSRSIAAGLALLALGGALVVAPPPPAEASLAGPAADAIQTCLVRSGIVPVAVDAAGAAEAARTSALRTLQHALLTAAPDALGGAELVVDDRGEAVGLRVLEAAPGAGPAAIAATVAALPAAASARIDDDAATVVGTAPASLRSLCAGFEQSLSAGGPAGDAIVSAAIDHGTATLRIGVDAAEASAAAPAVAADAAALPAATADAGDRAAQLPTAPAALLAALGLEALPVPVALVADVADAPTSRLDDRDGYGGGVAMRLGTIACTTGFAVRLRDGAPAVMSAGHCPSPDGANGALVTNGYTSQLCGSTGSGRTIGTVSDNLLTTGWQVDSMVMRSSAAAPTMWVGSSCLGTREVAVQGYGAVGPGDSVGFSGTRQGEQYGTRTSEPMGCYDFGFWGCATYRATSSSSTYLCLPGDSGGPVFRHRADGAVQALGIISASGYDLGINRCSYADIATALWVTGATIMTQASTQLPPPTRLAGADRYDTSAAVSRHGYPSGAGVAYVASGVAFADALSAGAAAAQQRGPLLLTAPGTLPDTVAAELRRLAPGQIVLVGGEPSVAAPVEEALRAIAPTIRLGGADRYETSALIARHAFAEGASESLIATGRSFPDALAAGPVAARRGAPLLLVDGQQGTAPPAVLDALRQLGVTRTTLVGGTPTISSALEQSLRSGWSVDRVAGVDRFDTAVRLNQAFGPTPPALYVASGEQFPDALAASAVAGARGAPLYLTRAPCMVGALPAEHARLGRPPVILLGGEPTLHAGVARYELCG